MESGSHAHRSDLHPLPCCPCGYLEYGHEVNQRWGTPMMLTSSSGIGTSRSRSHQDSSVAHDRDGAVDLHHPQQHYYTMAAVLIRRGFPSLSRAQDIGIALGLGFIAGSTHDSPHFETDKYLLGCLHRPGSVLWEAGSLAERNGCWSRLLAGFTENCGFSKSPWSFSMRIDTSMLRGTMVL